MSAPVVSANNKENYAKIKLNNGTTDDSNRQSSLDLASLADDTKEYHVWEHSTALAYLTIDQQWRTEFENVHCSNCEFCKKHGHLSMYTRYKICEKWHAAFKRLSCMSSIVNDASKMAEETLISYEEVLSWGKSFNRLMGHSIGRQIFKEFLSQEHSDENILFWEAVEIFKQLTDKDELKEFAQDLVNQFVSSNSKTEISLDSKCKAALQKSIKNVNKNTFNEAQEQVLKLMERDSYNRFTRSLIYRTFLQRQVPHEEVLEWGEKLESLLGSEVGRQVFYEFLQLEKADENLRFWEAVQKYKKLTPGTPYVKQRAQEIWDEYLSPESKNEVSLDSHSREAVKKDLELPTLELFNQAEQVIFQLMKRDPYNRFVISGFYKNFVEEHKRCSQPIQEVEQV